MSAPEAPIVVDEQTAADKLYLSVPYLRKLRNTGQLPCVRIGRSVRFLVSDLEAFAQAHRVGGDAS